MNKTLWTDPARSDLAKIHDFYQEDSPEYAVQIGRSAIKAGDFLQRHPFAGVQVDPGLRKWPVSKTKLRLFYRVMNDHVEVLRVRHIREDWRAAP